MTENPFEPPHNPFRDRGWFKKLAEAAEAEVKAKSEPVVQDMWAEFLAAAPGSGGGPAELPGEQRTSMAAMHSQFQGWVQAGFSEAQAFQLIRDQMQIAFTLGMRERLRRERDGD
jgi:hypothetical protein